MERAQHGNEEGIPQGFAFALDQGVGSVPAPGSPHVAIAERAQEGNEAASPQGFALALDQNGSSLPTSTDTQEQTCMAWFAKYPCFSNRGRTFLTLGCMTCVAAAVALYFTVPWVPIVEDILDWIDGKGTRGVVLLFVLHLVSMLSVVGPVNTLEYGWVFLRGWKAVPVIVLSYVLGIASMLIFGNTILRPCILRQVRGSRLMRATQRVLDHDPYAWYIAFQYWDIFPWRATVYCAHVLAPHANLALVGVAVFGAQMPQLFYRAFVATIITDLDSLVTGQLDTPLHTAIFWSSVVITTVISLLLYYKIRKAFMEASGYTPDEATVSSETEPSHVLHAPQEGDDSSQPPAEEEPR